MDQSFDSNVIELEEECEANITVPTGPLPALAPQAMSTGPLSGPTLSPAFIELEKNEIELEFKRISAQSEQKHQELRLREMELKHELEMKKLSVENASLPRSCRSSSLKRPWMPKEIVATPSTTTNTAPAAPASSVHIHTETAPVVPAPPPATTSQQAPFEINEPLDALPVIPRIQIKTQSFYFFRDLYDIAINIEGFEVVVKFLEFGSGSDEEISVLSSLKIWVFVGSSGGINMERYQTVLAMVFATHEINQNPNILPQISLGFRIYDSCYTEAPALEGTLWLLSGHQKSIPNYSCARKMRPAAIIGDSTSAATLPMARILGLSRYPQISFGAALPSLSDKVQFPSFLRTIANARARGFVELLLHFGWTWVGVFVADNDYGLENGQKLQEEALKSGICIEFFEMLPIQMTKKSLSHAIKVIRESTSRAIVCITFSPQMIYLLKEITAQNITGKVWIANTSWLPSPVFSLKDLWQTLNNTLGIAVYSGEIPMFKEFLYNIHPARFANDIFMKQVWEHAFSCQWVDDLNNTGKAAEGKRLCTQTEKLETLDMSEYDVNHFRFPYAAYNAIYALAQALHNLKSCRSNDGPFVNKTCADFPDFHPWQLFHYLKNVRTKNAAGKEVFFDKNGDAPPLTDIVTWQMSSKDTSRFLKVGTYDASAPQGQTLIINSNAIEWGGGYSKVPVSICTEPCPPGFRKSAIKGRPPCCFDCVLCSEGSISNQTDSTDCMKCPDDHWSSEQRNRCIPKPIVFLSYDEALGLTLACMSIVLSLKASFVLVVFVWYRDTPVVRANNRGISYLLLVSLVLCFLCAMIFIGHPMRVTCMLRQIVFGVIFSLCVSCILAKTITVVIAFSATKPDGKLRRLLGPKIAYTIVLACTLVQVTIGIAWMTISPSFPEHITSSAMREIIAQCNEGSIVWFYCMLAFMGLLASVSFLVSFIARNLPDSFNETKFITFSMLVFVSVWLSFVPAYLSTKGKYLVAVEIFAILSSGAGLLFCIFLAKVFIIFGRPERNTRQYLISKSKFL
ncbi:vomeronasal type-2 receptor 26-like [Ambystoma mexicanum]|uniref:vomeronasal type-2 receptor 26-like n=1 Tax=Ambystoma mexicanum TaxID=8296 RepID=UPI0037E889FD